MYMDAEGSGRHDYRGPSEERKSLDSRSLRSGCGSPLKAPLFRAFSDGVFRSLLEPAASGQSQLETRVGQQMTFPASLIDKIRQLPKPENLDLGRPRRFTPLGQHCRKMPPVPHPQLNMHPVIVLDVPTMSPFSSAQ